MKDQNNTKSLITSLVSELQIGFPENRTQQHGIILNVICVSLWDVMKLI